MRPKIYLAILLNLASFMSLNIQNIIPAIGAQFSGNPDATIDTVSIDSRSLQNNSGTLYFALSGQNHDGHEYLEELLSKGVHNFVVTQYPEQLKGKANFLVVHNTLEALQLFAAYYRNAFDFPIIGVTGSNGKTIVKEWLNFLLSPEYNIIRSPKSYNSQVGVPLSIIGINEKHNLGIFEAGISLVGEMAKLHVLIRPTIGVLTNIGSAHNEGFQSREQKISEKLKLFKDAEILIYAKNPEVDALIPAETKTWSWSFTDPNADVQISQKGTQLHIHTTHHTFTVTLPFQDSSSVENAITCLMVLLYFDYTPAVIQERLQLLYPVEMRLKVKNGINNTTLIDDSYNSDYQSLKIALDFLENQKQHQKKTVILSDIFQSGWSNPTLYETVAALFSSNQIDRIIGIGDQITTYAHFFSNITTYATTADFFEAYDPLDFENETILIKGARPFHFEEIVFRLEEKTHETVLEINLNAISHNLNFFKSKLQPGIKLMVMVKAFGYGSGSFEIARLLEYHKVDYLGVAFADEGIALRNAGITMPIMVMNPETPSFSAIINFGLEPEIYSVKELHAFLRVAAQHNVSDYPIHIKLDTGMHRLGFEAKDLDTLVAVVKDNPRISIKSVLSHLATSDEPEQHDFTLSQIARFDLLSSQLLSTLHIQPLRHILNTSGISNFPHGQYDMVRLGIGLYGVSNDENETKYLENVGTLKSVISQIRTIEAGESVGYGRKFIASDTTVIATIPIGYADGIRRSWGNEVGYLIVNHQKAPIVGNICMDMLMINITGIACHEGDTVTVFGENPSVTVMAKALGTIPYEILTSISQRVKRVFYRE